MALFKDMLGEHESLFTNEVALDFDFLPKLLPYREDKQHYFAACIKPLLQGRNGKNLFIHGPPGIGKTAAVRFVLRDLEEDSDEVYPIYVNCWQKNTTYKIMLDICDQLGNKFTHNKRTEELFAWAKATINKKSVVFVFDEVDKLEDYDFLYSILEEVFKKTVFLLTNYEEWLVELDDRVKSRLMPEVIEFARYSPEETEGILKQRLEYAFVPGVWDVDGFKMIAQKAAELGDIRTGLYLLKSAGDVAEMKSSRKILKEHAEEGIHKLTDFSSKKKDQLDGELTKILNLVKANSGKKIGEVFELYKQGGSELTYKSFQRKVRKLADNRFISTKKMVGGSEGTTTILYADTTKKLDEF